MNQKKRLSNIRGDFSGALSAAIISIPLSIGYGIIVYGPLGAGFLPLAALLGIYGCLLGGICASLLGGTEIQITAPKAPAAMSHHLKFFTTPPLCNPSPLSWG